MKRYAYAWLTAGFFLVSIALHWVFGWYAFVDEQKALDVPVELRWDPLESTCRHASLSIL